VDGVLASLGMGLMAMGIVTVPLAAVWTGLAIGLGRAQNRIATGRGSGRPGGLGAVAGEAAAD
jgi:hypothetical protein